MSSYLARIGRAYSFPHLPPLEAKVLSIQFKTEVSLLFPKTMFLVLSFYFFSSYCAALNLFMTVGSCFTLVAVPWCTTVRRADFLSGTTIGINLHFFGGILLAQGPILWGLIPVPFALIMPTIAKVSSHLLSWRKSPQLFIVAYVWVTPAPPPSLTS